VGGIRRTLKLKGGGASVSEHTLPPAVREERRSVAKPTLLPAFRLESNKINIFDTQMFLKYILISCDPGFRGFRVFIEDDSSGG
jgi:hypothetical protein